MPNPSMMRPSKGSPQNWFGGRRLIIALIYLIPLRDFPLVARSTVAIRFFDIGVLVVVAGWVARLAVTGHTPRFDRHTVVSFFIFLIWVTSSSFLGYFNDGSVSLILRLFLLAVYSILVYAVAYKATHHLELRDFVRHLTMSLVAGGVVAGLLHLLYPNAEKAWAGATDLTYGTAGVTRFAGFASEPNYWGSLFLFLMPLAFLAILEPKTRQRLRLSAPLLGALVLFAVITFSTFTQLAIVLALIEGIIISRGRLQKVLAATTLIILLLTVRYRRADYYTYISTKLGSLQQVSTYERFYWSYSALRMWLTAPILGHGIGTYVTHYGDYLDVDLRPAEQANSVFLATLAEQGIMGVAILSYMLMTAAGLRSRAVVNTIRRDKLVSSLALGLSLYVPYFLITGSLYLYYFWFYMGAFHGYARRTTTSHGPALESEGPERGPEPSYA